MTEDEEFEADEKARIAAIHKTAPETIWLQADPDAEMYDGWDAITWCDDRINDTDLMYVRVDLADKALEKCEEIFDDIFHPLSLDQETQEACSKFRTAIRADPVARRTK